jgi:hypothetical protein
MTNACFPFPTLREQDEIFLSERIRELEAKLASYSLASLRNMAEKDFSASGLREVGDYIVELRTSRDMWKRIATDRAHELARSRREIIEELKP